MTSAPHPTHQAFWLWVMCLTGVDYFSTLGYQPSIAFEATGLLAPIATVILIAVTLFCALPVYSHVAGESFTGQGSISMLEKLLRGWSGKILVLVLLGFAATDFVITKTLSAADAAEHLVHNPLWHDLPAIAQSQLLLTMFLLVLLGGVFMRGFKEAIGIAVGLVSVYLLLNIIVIGSSVGYVVMHPSLAADWFRMVQNGEWHMAESSPFTGLSWFSILATCFIFFPKLALGLSGFETGVAVMPLVRGSADDDPDRPRGRIQNTRKLLTTAAIIMSIALFGSAVATATLIRPDQLKEGGRAVDRALAYIAHGESGHPINPLFGDVFGTIYDLSTVSILWFAGASAMSGLLNLVPRYLPRFGMAPEWVGTARPLVVLFTVVNLIVTWFFNADVSAQGGAYATGVMVLISSACVAVVIDKWNKQEAGSWIVRMPWRYVLITAVFFYTTIAIVIEKPEGLAIASIFVVTVVLLSLLSRTMRATELRFIRFNFIDDHTKFLWDTLKHLEFPVLVPHRAGRRTILEKEEEIRAIHRLGPEIPIVYVEATLGDASEFYHSPLMEIVEEEGRFIIRVSNCASIAHVVATIALELSKSGRPPEIHFGWSEESPFSANLRFILFGEGNIPWLVRELIRLAEPEPAKRPRVVVG
jgi:hypothetical protein